MIFILTNKYNNNSGRQFDKDGNMERWWDEDAIDKFKERAQCLIDQYGNYTAKQVSMNVSIA